MKKNLKFIALGGAHWDIVGRAPFEMQVHQDVPGKIQRVVGGVAGPVAMKLGNLARGLDIQVELIAYFGQDDMGHALREMIEAYNVNTRLCIEGTDPTDIYMAIEATNGLISAIADCNSLEKNTKRAVDIFLETSADYAIIDGNLSSESLDDLSKAPIPGKNIVLIPASPGKISRFEPFIDRGGITIYLNLTEANLLTNRKSPNSEIAAKILGDLGFDAIVTHGPNPASSMIGGTLASATPPDVVVRRFTGAGDTFAAHHMFAMAQGFDPETALKRALENTATFITAEETDV